MFHAVISAYIITHLGTYLGLSTSSPVTHAFIYPIMSRASAHASQHPPDHIRTTRMMCTSEGHM